MEAPTTLRFCDVVSSGRRLAAARQNLLGAKTVPSQYKIGKLKIDEKVFKNSFRKFQSFYILPPKLQMSEHQ